MPRDLTPEVPRGDTDLVAFYNLLSIYSNISKRTKTTNYHARLSGTGFSSYRWYGGEGCSLANLPVTPQQFSLAAEAPSVPALFLENFKLLPGKVSLTEAEKGPLVDTSALGEVPSLDARAGINNRKAAERAAQEAEKPKKSKKEKKKRKRSLDAKQE